MRQQVGRLLVGLFIALPLPSLSAGLSAEIPSWLNAHVGTGEGQIAAVVLQRARAFYGQRLASGAVRNLCYFAMDATRPNSLADGSLGRRFYIICEGSQTFRAISSGHGSGRNLKGIADFKNDRQCAQNFGNALGSELTTGGGYVTAETKTSFKGYYRTPSKDIVALMRPFLQFEGQGETGNARTRAIGGHPAVVIRNACRTMNASSPYVDPDGYVPLGTLVDYSGGRSNGCTSWSPSDAGDIFAMVQNNPTTLYIYPDVADIDAVAQATARGQSLSKAGLYWNASCLKEIGAPKYWSNAVLGPIIAQYAKDHPLAPSRPLPICKGRS
ncbi:MAG: hypothetical protein ABI832_06840 [bacterium]